MLIKIENNKMDSGSGLVVNQMAGFRTCARVTIVLMSTGHIEKVFSWLLTFQTLDSS